jgi:hypothetical protein
VREQLLFKAGEPWWDARGRESARNLRSLDFLEPWSIEPHREGDSVVVKVVTRDAWSTRPEFNIESADGKQYGSLGLNELNFAGLGKALSFFYRDLPSGRSRSMATDPSLLGSRVRLRFGAATGRAGRPTISTSASRSTPKTPRTRTRSRGRARPRCRACTRTARRS